MEKTFGFLQACVVSLAAKLGNSHPYGMVSVTNRAQLGTYGRYVV